MTYQVIISRFAQDRINEILNESRINFGRDTATSYRILFREAVIDLTKTNIPLITVDSAGKHFKLYPLRLSPKKARPKSPTSLTTSRHILCIDEDNLKNTRTIIAIFHDAMDIPDRIRKLLP